MAEEKLALKNQRLDSLSEIEQIRLLAARATEANYSFAFYRMPKDKQFQFIAGKCLEAIDHEDLSSDRPASCGAPAESDR